MSGIESWSTTPANNNQAPPYGWPGGILPNQVEPIGRQMMASLAAWYQAAEWINYNFTITYSSATVFTVPGNATGTYHVGRRVQATDGSTSVYGTITTSVFTSLTTVTVAWDSGSLQTGVTIVYVGINSAVNTSIPNIDASRISSGTLLSARISGSYTGITAIGNATALDDGGSAQAVGWRGTPLNTQAASYTAVLADRGKTINHTANGSTHTVPANVFSGGDAYSIRVPSGAAITVAQGSSLTLNWAGNGSTTGSRTLTGEGLCTVLFLSATVATISGAGLT